MQLDPVSLLFGSCAAVLAGFSKTGLPGAGIPTVVLMAAAFPGHTELSVGCLLVVLLVGDVFAVTRFGRHAQWQRLLTLFPYVVAGAVPAYFVLGWLDDRQFRPLLGVLVLALLGLEAARENIGYTTLVNRPCFTRAMGFLAGFGSTVANAGGPMMTIYLLGKQVDKEQFIGTCAWFFFLLNLSKVVPFLFQGILTSETICFGLAMSPLAIAGALAGARLLPRVSQRVFNALVSLLAAVAAVWLIVS